MFCQRNGIGEQLASRLKITKKTKKGKQKKKVYKKYKKKKKKMESNTEGSRPEWYISLLYIMLEIHLSSRERSNITSVSGRTTPKKVDEVIVYLNTHQCMKTCNIDWDE